MILESSGVVVADLSPTLVIYLVLNLGSAKVRNEVGGFGYDSGSGSDSDFGLMLQQSFGGEIRLHWFLRLSFAAGS